MLGSTSGRFQFAASLACAALLAGGVVSCASSTTQPVLSYSDSQEITDVRVERDGEMTTVFLMGLDEPVFTAFGMANPDRIVVDLASHPGRLIDPIEVGDGLVSHVTVSPYSTGTSGDTTRIEVTLESPASFEVVAASEGLEIRVAPQGGAVGTAPVDGSDPWADDTAAALGIPSFNADESVGQAAAVEASPATTLMGVTASEIEDGALIHLHSNGPISSVVSFTLEDPARLVIDLNDLSNEASEKALEVGSARVERIRVGGHSDKVRVVVDGGDSDDPFDGRQLIPTQMGLIVALGQSETLDKALDMAVQVAKAAQRRTAMARSEASESPMEEATEAEAEEVTETAAGEATEAGAEEVTETAAGEAAEAEAEEATETAWDEATETAWAWGEFAETEAEEATEVAVEEGAEALIEEAAAEVDASELEPQSVDPELTESTAVATAEPTEDTAETPATEASEESTEVVDEIPDEEIEITAAEAWGAPEPIDRTAEAPEISAVSPSTATIYGIEYDAQDTRDRIVVFGDAVLEYSFYEPTPETLVISMTGAHIDPEAAVRIKPEPGGPISLVTAFEQPELESPEVRLVVQRAAGLIPEVSRRGSLLIIDFPRTGDIAATPAGLTEFEEDSALESEPIDLAPTEVASTEAVNSADDWAEAPASIPAPSAGIEVVEMGAATDPMPAAMDPGASIDILQTGGLSAGKRYMGRRISLDFKDVEIGDVLRLIAEVSELNVIAGDEVKGKVTIRLVDVPWDQALDVVLLTKSLGFMRIGNVLRIAPSSVIAQEEELRLQERRVKEKLQDLVVKLQPVNYADVGEIAKMVSKLLTPGRGTVTTDKRTSTLIIKDIPSVIDEATALIKAIDTQTPQVMIEAKIVEANLDFKREFGTEWGIGAQPLVDAFDPSSPNRSDLGSDAVRFNNNGFGNNAVFSNPITAAPTGLFNLAAFLLDEKLNLNLTLQAAEVNGDGKVISSPRLVTLDNSKASIAQGVSIPFQTYQNGDPQLEFVDAVLKLEVTPHITSDKSIIMKIAVKRNAPDDTVFTLTGSPAIAKNEIKTETLVKDGQTLVLGGIYVIVKSERHSNVPFLSSIPLIGAAFRSDEKGESRKELLIFVTPRIVMPVEDAV